jgi:hypothetical protein
MSSVEKAEILRLMQSVRCAWQSAVDRIPVERMEEPNGDGPWSVKDEIAHVAFYDRRLAGRLAAFARGAEPTHRELYDHPGAAPMYTGDLDAFNAAIQGRYADMTAAQVVDAARRAYDDLAAAVESVPEAAWARPTDFTGERTLAGIMPGNTWVHYAKHLPPLEVFIGRM